MGCITSSNKSTEDCLEKSFYVSRPKIVGELSPIKGSKSTLPVATRTTEVLSICDDFGEGCDADDEKSYGYFSESISTANTSGISFDANDCDLKMEMYMMTKISRVIPRTSSPILPVRGRFAPRDATFEVVDEEQSSSSYNKWKRHLQRTPPYVLNNVTRIPEAIAGQFTPEGFPGYTDVKRCLRGSYSRTPERRPFIVHY